MSTDPIADMLTRIRNASMVKHDSITVPASKTKIAIAQILKNEGFTRGFELLKGKTPQHKNLKIQLMYKEKKAPVINGLRRVSRPGLRTYSGKSEIPRVFGGLGTAILSTPKGVMTGQQAWRSNVGGEVICFVW
ncbi:MAG: 30S ribosomal protein S8 [Dehalococcoidia bacterium]|nr:30S ribosomal protein S8 [Dehalococcoidia bacterium]